MTPLSSHAQSILDATKTSQTVDPTRASANLEALQQRMLAGDLGPDFDPGLPPAPDVVAGNSIATGAKIVGGLLVASAIALSLQGSKQDPSSAVRQAPALAGVQLDEAAATTPELEPGLPTQPTFADVDLETKRAAEGSGLGETRSAQPGEAQPSAAQAPKAAPSANERAGKAKPTQLLEGLNEAAEPDEVGSSSIDRLEAEMALMSDARRALGRGDARKALVLLDQHASEFPRGEFRRERVVSRVTALCALGQPKAAKREAKRYLATDSTSVHAQRISQTCAANDEP